MPGRSWTPAAARRRPRTGMGFCELSAGYAGSDRRHSTVIIRRHCEPTGRANARPMTGSAKQSILPVRQTKLDCFVALLLAMTASIRRQAIQKQLAAMRDRIASSLALLAMT